MTALFDWLASDGGRALLLALAHSFWVGGLAWVTLAWVFRRIPARRSSLRYGFAVGAQGFVCLATLFIWSWFASDARQPAGGMVSGEGRSGTAVESATGEIAALAQAGPASGNPSTQTDQLAKPGQLADAQDAARPTVDWPRWWGLAWLMGAVLVLVWRAVHFGRTWRLSARCPAITDGPWQTLLEEERVRMAYRGAVVLRVVDGLVSPAAWGFFQPVILIPASMVTGLSSETMRMILVHELSHLRRWDPLVQALQYVVEAVFFFNPCVWLLSRQIGLEREACCDAVAADRADAPTYAGVLLAVGRQAGRAGPKVAAPAALGDGKPSSLAARVGRLLRPADCPSPKLSLRLLLLALVIALVTVLVGRQASDAAVAALTHQQWIQKIQSVLKQERRAQMPIEWKQGDQMILTGRITNQAGEALPEATVRLTAHYADGVGMHEFSVQVDDAGYYRREFQLTDYSPAQRPYAFLGVTVAAPGFEKAERQQVPTVKGEVEVNFSLEPGLPVEIEFVNEAGLALAATELELEYAGDGFRFSDTHTTDAQGRLELVLPPDEILWFTIRAAGYRDWRQQRAFANDSNTMQVTLRQGVPIRGIVRDAETGQPIAGAGVFLVQSISLDGSQSRSSSFWAGQPDPLVRTNAEGVFEIYSLDLEYSHWLVIDAPGYLVGVPGVADSRKDRKLNSMRAVSPSGETVEVNLIPKRPLQVKILTPAGWPTDGGTKGRLRYSHAYITGDSYGGHSHGSRLRRQAVEVEQGVIETTVEPTMAFPLRIGLNRSYGPELTLEGWDYAEPVVVDLRDQPPVTLLEQEYIVRFELPESAPLPQGEIRVDYTGGGYISSGIAAPLEAGIARFTIEHQFDRVPEIDSTGVIGYTFEKQELSRPADGETGPVVHTVRAVQPAGAVTLSIENTQPDETIQIVVDAYKPFGTDILPFWSKMDWSTEHRIEMPAGQTEVVINPLPLGRKLRVTVRQDNSWMRENLSPIRETNPFPQQKIRMPEGDSVSGRVLDPNGQPLGGTPVMLNLVYDRSSSSYTTSHFRTHADAQGFFEFDRVNFDADGVYYLAITSVSEWRPYQAVLKEPKRDLLIKMEASLPRILRVVVAETGMPISGRSIEIHQRGLPDGLRFMAQSIRPAAVTNAKGELRVDRLPPSGRFDFRVWMPVRNDRRDAYNEEREIHADDRTIVIRVPAARLR